MPFQRKTQRKQIEETLKKYKDQQESLTAKYQLTLSTVFSQSIQDIQDAINALNKAPNAWSGLVSISGPSLNLETPKELPLSFQSEPIVAYRMWDLSPYHTRELNQEWRLTSIGVRGLWTPYQRMEAACVNHYHESPFSTCHCGIWALKTDDLLNQARPGYAGSHKAWGEVYLWGRVLQCQNGYRAQYAYPKRIFVDNSQRNIAKEVENLYGVPVDVVKGKAPNPMAEMGSFYPPTQGLLTPPSYYTSIPQIGSGTSSGGGISLVHLGNGGFSFGSTSGGANLPEVTGIGDSEFGENT